MGAGKQLNKYQLVLDRATWSILRIAPDGNEYICATGILAPMGFWVGHRTMETIVHYINKEAKRGVFELESVPRPKQRRSKRRSASA